MGSNFQISNNLDKGFQKGCHHKAAPGYYRNYRLLRFYPRFAANLCPAQPVNHIFPIIKSALTFLHLPTVWVCFFSSNSSSIMSTYIIGVSFCHQYIQPVKQIFSKQPHCVSPLSFLSVMDGSPTPHMFPIIKSAATCWSFKNCHSIVHNMTWMKLLNAIKHVWLRFKKRFLCSKTSLDRSVL